MALAHIDHSGAGVAGSGDRSCLDRRKKGIEPPPRWQHPSLTSGIPLLRAAAERARQFGEATPATVCWATTMAGRGR
jgi:hypothetical protein